MNRHEALAHALQAIARGERVEGRRILQSNFLCAHPRAPDDLTDVQERTKIYEANSYRSEPWPEFIAAALLAVVDGLDKRDGALVDRSRNFLRCALDVSMEESCGVDALAEMVIAGREATDQGFIMTCIYVAKHHLEWKDPSAARKWLDRLEGSSLGGIFLKTVENISRECQDEESKIKQAPDPRRLA
jgi:hypothetical protein